LIVGRLYSSDLNEIINVSSHLASLTREVIAFLPEKTINSIENFTDNNESSKGNCKSGSGDSRDLPPSQIAMCADSFSDFQTVEPIHNALNDKHC
jgi:hypothetical protein